MARNRLQEMELKPVDADFRENRFEGQEMEAGGWGSLQRQVEGINGALKMDTEGRCRADGDRSNCSDESQMSSRWR